MATASEYVKAACLIGSRNGKHELYPHYHNKQSSEKQCRGETAVLNQSRLSSGPRSREQLCTARLGKAY